ncbi:MAG: hypothetical protein WC141_07870 [Arcobacteraceae bacterium]
MRSLILALLLSNSLWAHKINLFITHDKNELQLFSYFASGAPCKECKVIIKHNDETLLEGNLDKEGKFSYVSVYDKLMIIIDGSSGHLVQKEVTLTQIPEKSLEKLVEEEEEGNIFKIFLSLGLIGLFFYGVKRFKSRAK